MDNKDIIVLSKLVTKQVLMAISEEVNLIKMCADHEKEDHQLELAKLNYCMFLAEFSNDIQEGVLKVLEGELDHDELVDSLNEKLTKAMKGGE